MNDKYLYLKKYKPGGDNVNDNWFLPVSLNKINELETEFKFSFPSQLKDFYLSIGHGMLRSPKIRPALYEFYSKNEILPPYIAIDYMQGIIEHPDDEAYYMSRDFYEDMEPGDLPFFEIGDSSSYMIMKLNSDNPNAVWYMGVEKIEDTLEKFIWRLYHEDPEYYTKNW